MKYVTLLLLLSCGYLSGAQVVIPDEMKIIQAQLADIKNMTYDYSISQTYPDKTTDKMKGKIISTKKLYWEHTGDNLIMQSDKWYYRVNHEDKTIYIIDVAKKPGKKSKSFESLVTFIPDMIFNKYGKITTKTEGTVIKVTIVFGPEVLVKKVYLEYDTKKKVPLLYQVELDRIYGIDNNNFEEKYLRQVFTATNFLSKSEKATTDISGYFSYDNGKITLKKYANYKLIQQL